MAAKVDYSTRQSTYEANLRAAYRAAVADAPQLFNAGLKWYDLVRAQIDGIADRHGVSRDACYGATAALSVEQDWARNIAGLQLALDGIAAGARSGDDISGVANKYGAARRKAFSVLVDGLAPLFVLGNYGKPTDAYKTRRFYACLAGDEYAVCIDRHHARICHGFAAGKRQETLPQPNGEDYLAMERATVVVAREVGITPARLQAGLWCWFRGELF